MLSGQSISFDNYLNVSLNHFMTPRIFGTVFLYSKLYYTMT